MGCILVCPWCLCTYCRHTQQIQIQYFICTFIPLRHAALNPRHCVYKLVVLLQHRLTWYFICFTMWHMWFGRNLHCDFPTWWIISSQDSLFLSVTSSMKDSGSCVLCQCLGWRRLSGLVGMLSCRPVRSCSEPLLSTAQKLYCIEATCPSAVMFLHNAQAAVAHDYTTAQWVIDNQLIDIVELICLP